MVGRLQPLVDNQPIVGPNGLPTQYFIRWAQQRQIDIGDAVSEARALQIVEEFLADHPLIAGSGIALAPSGNIGQNVTISAQVQAILNQITTTRGSVLFRGATDWQALAPGTAGQFLQTSGAGADPIWAAGGGGGASVPLLSFVGAAPGANSGNINVPGLNLVQCIALSTAPVVGLIIPCSNNVAGRTATPCIYDGGFFAAPTAPVGTPLVASGSGVALTNNSMISCPFTTPFVPTVGKLYFAGFAFSGTAGTMNLWASNTLRAYTTNGAFTPPPANAPSMTAISSTATGWWSY